jgi:hypothetical protein
MGLENFAGQKMASANLPGSIYRSGEKFAVCFGKICRQFKTKGRRSFAPP